MRVILLVWFLAKVVHAEPTPPTAIEQDLRTMIGGNFTPDHLGPDVYRAILARLRERPNAYLDELVDHVVGPHPEPGWLSAVHVPAVLDLVGAIQLVKPYAKRLLPIFQAALRAATPPPANDEYRATRLAGHVRTLELLSRD
jgi:hypothetical protein